MINQWIRVLYSDNGVLTDYSLESNDDTGFVTPIIASEDYIYIGQYYPFNNIFIKSLVANTSASNLSLQYWASNKWQDCVDILDGTKTNGKTLAKSGVVIFSPDKDQTWTDVDDTAEGSPRPTELQSVEIYNLYWLRLKFSANLLGTTKISKIGYMFTRESILTQLDPDINEYLGKWQTGKTSWLDQILIASEHAVLDLKGKGLIKSAGQLLRYDEIYYAVAWKTLSIIYAGLGQKFIEKRQYAENQYASILTNSRMLIDSNNDAVANKQELRQGVMVR